MRWAIIFSLAILFGWLGLHRFAVKKIGTGFVFLFSAGLLGIGWLVDVVSLLRQRFTDSSGIPLRRHESRREARLVIGNSSNARVEIEGLIRSTTLGVDGLGRQIVSLAWGRDISISAHEDQKSNQSVFEEYVLAAGLNKQSSKQETVLRMRLIPEVREYWGGSCFSLETPAGDRALEVRSYFKNDFQKASRVVDAVSRQMGEEFRQAHDLAFSIEVPVLVSFEVYTLLDGSGQLRIVISDSKVQLAQPLRIDG